MQINRKSEQIKIAPIELAQANAFVSLHHRHHKPTVGHRFSICAVVGSEVRGVAIVGRAVSRHYDPLSVLEVTRLCTDGTPNACSALYSAAARVGKNLGFARIQTYILETETGGSLFASGWICEGEAGGGQWKHSDGKPRRTDQPTCKKLLFSKTLNETLHVNRPAALEDLPQLTLEF